MIFVTVGGTSHSFKRMVQRMDEIASGISDEVLIQKGWTDYDTASAKSFDFVEYEEAIKYFKNADIIVSHASAGPMLYARKFSKPLILVPRRGDLNEHVDNHQMETVQAITGNSEMIEIVYDVNDLENAIERAFEKIKNNVNYEPPVSLEAITACIKDFVSTTEQSKKR